MAQTPRQRDSTMINYGDAVRVPPTHEPEAMPPIAHDPTRDPSREESPMLSPNSRCTPPRVPGVESGCVHVHARVEPSMRETPYQDTPQVGRARSHDASTPTS